MLGDVIDKRFDDNIVGEMYEDVMEKGKRRNNNIKIGINGGWKRKVDNSWYFKRERDGSEMKDDEIRGGMDGMVMGKFIKEWRKKLKGNELRI
jgi:hypothetical protein